MLHSSKRVILFLLVFCALSYNLWRDWMGKREPFISDVSVYYSYIEATFIKHDLSFSYPNSHWLQKTPTGHAVPKMSMGLAFIYTPFFLVCHAITLLTGGEANGYSEVYAYGMYYSAMLFVFLGLFVLRKILLRFYAENIVSLTLLSIFLGTNLFYYSVSFNLMTHGFLFTLYSLLLYYTIRWHETLNVRYLLCTAFIAGLCTLIRPTGIFILVVPALWGCNTLQDVKQRIKLLWDHRTSLLFAALIFMAPWVPQLVYWKVYSGSFFFYTYGEEGFNFMKPQLLNVLFSYRKGWLVYTPIMLFALCGFYYLFKQRSKLFLPLIVLFPVSLYVLSCWWCWAWGGSFGIRALVEYYAFLAFPMAAFFTHFASLQKAKTATYLVTTVLILFNLLQTYQYTRLIIHWDGMTRESYWYGFGKVKFTEEERKQFNSLLGQYSAEVPEDYKHK